MELTNTSVPWEHCVLRSSVAYPVIIVNSLASLFGTLGNALVWMAVMKNSRLQTLTNYFLLSLALADMLVSSLTQPLFVVQNIFSLQHQCSAGASRAYELAAYFSCMASILNITAVSIDRLISLKYPLQKRTILPKRRGFSIIAASWGLAFSYTAISYFYHKTMVWVITTFAYFAVCYLTMIVTHSHMYVVSHRFVQRRKREVRRHSFSMIAYSKEKQAAKTIALIIAMLTLTWFPYGCGIALSAASGTVLKRSLAYPLFTVGLLNSSINPVLYSWRNKDFRTTFCQLLRCQDPNLMRRESVSSLYIRRSRISTASMIFNDCNTKVNDKDGAASDDTNTLSFIVSRHFSV